MKTPIILPLRKLFSLCILVCCAIFGLQVNAQAQCDNPTFPTCLPPSALKVMIVLDESGSIRPVTSEFESAVRNFAQALNSRATESGQFQMGIIEFSSGAGLGMPLTDVRNANFLSDVDRYLNIDYDPQPFFTTNFVAALTEVRNFISTVTDLDIVFFISDGNPNGGVTGSDIADDIKCDGTYMFGVALGQNINVGNIQAISGPDELNNPLNLIDGADWMQQNIDGLADALVDLANSIIDNSAPAIACPSIPPVENDEGVCGAVVNFEVTANDDCTEDLPITAVPPSGSTFSVGTTTVTATITDEVGNTSECSFTITVNDTENPNMTCPPNVTVSCEESVDPGRTGTPVATDNCGIDETIHVDSVVNGSCTEEKTIERTWTVTDIHGNDVTCKQVIEVVDETPPIVTAPADIEVSCDTTTAATGIATVTDNCDSSPDLMYTDVVISGDCEWRCIIERTWTATDHCGNSASDVQNIEKNVLPLLTEALEKDINGDGLADPLVLGVTETTLTITADNASCILEWLPYNGDTPSALKRENVIVGADCRPSPNPLDADGRITNPLFGETLELALYLRLHPEFGDTKVADLGCEVAPIVLQNMARNPDVNEFLRVTQMAVGNRILVPHLRELLEALQCITGTIELCDDDIALSSMN